MQTKKVAKKIEKMGRKGDTILAHINPKEAAMLKAHGGAGKKHPKTGLLQFYDGSSEYEGGEGNMGTDYGGTDYGGALGGFADYNGMMGGSLNGFADTPNADMSLSDQYGQYGAGRQLAEQAAGYGMGATNNLLGSWADQYATMNPFARSFFGGLGAIGSYLGNTSLGTNTGGATGISQSDPFSSNYAGTGGAATGNGFDGGNLPGDNATTPTVPTTPGTGTTAPGLPITPPNWGNYGPSPFTYKFGQPRNMSGLLNFGS